MTEGAFPVAFGYPAPTTEAAAGPSPILD